MMNLLSTLRDADVGSSITQHFVKQKERHAARAIVLMDGKVGLLHARRDDYFKLPGGGVEDGEDYEVALVREALEELGVHVKITGEVGMIIEERAENGLYQVSACYIAEQFGEVGEPDYTEKEIAEGFEVVWAEDIDAAISMVGSAKPYPGGGKFMLARDLLFLETARELLQNV